MTIVLLKHYHLLNYIHIKHPLKDRTEIHNYTVKQSKRNTFHEQKSIKMSAFPTACSSIKQDISKVWDSAFRSSVVTVEKRDFVD